MDSFRESLAAMQVSASKVSSCIPPYGIPVHCEVCRLPSCIRAARFERFVFSDLMVKEALCY